MNQTLVLPLDGFARQTLAATASMHGLAPSALVAEAASYFLVDREKGRPARLLPAFASAEHSLGERLELELDLDIQTWGQLNEEAQRQGVSVALLLGHATLYLIADLNAGHPRAQLRSALAAEAAIPLFRGRQSRSGRAGTRRRAHPTRASRTMNTPP